MKNKRQREILALIQEYSIDTQEELTAQLSRKGFSCTQATVSRDIRELKLVKVADERGGYKYAVSTSNDGEKRQGVKYNSILSETVLGVQYAGNMVVIKTFDGMAMAACAAIDAMKWEGVLGTIAGDDTIFLVAKEEEIAKSITDRISIIIDRRS